MSSARPESAGAITERTRVPIAMVLGMVSLLGGTLLAAAGRYTELEVRLARIEVEQVAERDQVERMVRDLERLTAELDRCRGGKEQ